MNLFRSFLFMCLICAPVLSQTIEFGPTLQYHRTAFQRPDGSINVNIDGVTEGTTTTETNPNVAFGGYAAYYTENTFAYAAEYANRVNYFPSLSNRISWVF